MKAKGMYVIFERKKGGGIIPTLPVEYNEKNNKEYIRKLEFYLPQMLQLIRGEVMPEHYPRRTLYSFNSPCKMCDYAGLCLSGDIAGLEFREKTSYTVPYISPTEIIIYETCPRQWAYSRAGIKKETVSASVSLGDALHQSIEAYLLLKKPPEEVLREIWDEKKDIEMIYPQKHSWESFMDIGGSLAKKFPDFWERFSQEQKIDKIIPEKKNSKKFSIGDIDIYLSGRPDLVALTESEDKLIIDWKLTTVKYEDDWCRFSDQMIAYFIILS